MDYITLGLHITYLTGQLDDVLAFFKIGLLACVSVGEGRATDTREKLKAKLLRNINMGESNIF